MRAVIAAVLVVACLSTAAAAAESSRLEGVRQRTADLLAAKAASPQKIEIGDDTCMLCEALASFIAPLVRANVTRDIIDAAAVIVCEAMKVDCDTPAHCHEECVGIINEYSDEVIELLVNTLLTPQQLCYFIDLCPAPTPPQPPSDIPVRSNLSDTSGEHHWPSWDLTTGSGTFLHISDLHMDVLYKEGMMMECGFPVCCREVNGPGNTTANSAGKWGSYDWCDTPPATVEHMMNFVANMKPQPDFILYTGDDPAHDVWMQSRESNLAIIDKLSAFMVQYFPNIPVFSAIGNHETYPVNQYKGPPYDSWLYDVVALDWSHYLPNDALATLKYGGYYQARVRPGLRVISLQSNYYMSDNFWLVENFTDYSAQLLWMADVLQQAKDLKEKVIIIGHAAPSSLLSPFVDDLLALVESYQDVIVGNFYGHAHTSHIGVFHDNATDTKPINIAYLAGSLTPYTQLNPGFRIYDYSRSLKDRWLVTNFHDHWTDLSVANLAGNQPDWTEKLDAKSYFNLTDLSPVQWDAFARSLPKSTAALKAYVYDYYRGVTQSHEDSGMAMMCDALAMTDPQYSKCMKSAGVTGARRRPNDRC